MNFLNIKIPKIKFKKMKIGNNILDELQYIDYEKLERKNVKNRTTPYEDMTHYKTVKEFFLKSIQEYANTPCILEKPNHKEPYQTISYQQFGEDVLGLGTALIDLLKLKGKIKLI